MTILENYLPELPVDSETPSSSQWQWSNEDMRNYALASVAAYRKKMMQQPAVAYRSSEQYSPDVGCWFEYYDEYREINDTSGLTPLYAAPMPQDKEQKITDELTIHLNFKVHVDWVIE